jgi:hypothetical protein
MAEPISFTVTGSEVSLLTDQKKYSAEEFISRCIQARPAHGPGYLKVSAVAHYADGSTKSVRVDLEPLLS